VVHPPNGRHGVIQADGYTRTEKGLDDGGSPAGMTPSDVNADSLLQFIGPWAARKDHCSR
jgi:hypothetical protein